MSILIKHMHILLIFSPCFSINKYHEANRLMILIILQIYIVRAIQPNSFNSIIILHKFVPPLILVAYIVNPPFLWYTLFDPCGHHRFQRWSFPACLQGSFFVSTFFISHWNRPPFFFILHDIPPSSPSLVAKFPFFDANFILDTL